MKKLIFKLLILADKFPDGFSIVLPDGSMIQISWLFGMEIKEVAGEMKINQAFGVSLKGSDFDEVIITLYITG